MAKQSKLAGYIGIERPAILTALGLPTDDLTGLDQLWEQFAQLTATGRTGEGKTLTLVDALPESGNEDTYYGLKAAVEAGTAPLTDPVADTPFNAFLSDSPDLSGITLDTPVSITSVDSDGISENVIVQVSLASTFIADAVSGGSSRFLWALVASKNLGYVYLDGEVTASAETYSAGWYMAYESSGLPVAPFMPISYEEFVKQYTTGSYTLPQEAIDEGFAVLLTTFTDYYARGIYDFDGTNYNLQLDLTDFSAQLEENAMELSGLRSDIEMLKAWKQEVETAAGTANGGA